MTAKQIKDYFANRSLGIQGARGEYAVLIPLVQHEGELCLLFETRADTLKGHRGEVCFPGGRREPGELPEETALRETKEELGIPAEEITILAPLDWVQDISDRVVYPFLAEISPRGLQQLQQSRAEVKNVFFVPLKALLDCPDEVYRCPVQMQIGPDFPYDRVGISPDYPWRRGVMEVPVFEYRGHVIWGMTGRMLRWLLPHLRALEGQG